MNRIEAALRRAATDLNRYGRPWGLVGGLAVSARAEPRFTRDVDIAVAVEDDIGAQELVRHLLGDRYILSGTVEHDNGRLASVRLRREIDDVDVVVDLLFANSGIETEVARAAESIEIVAGLTLPVARTGHLLALKLLARDDAWMPQDLADLHALRSVATPADLTLAEDAVRLIMDRGFNRGRDLVSALRALNAEQT
ncbi:MAG: nucleotidyl transferase AbiEii/AbiGii toxin family protein [Micromonosporaceae bacterium]